jgi:outer membrane protein TolC
MFTVFIKRKLIFLFLLGCTATLRAQPMLDRYITEAFANNQGLKQQNINLDKALYALDEARSFYLPNISFNANYTLADGGRTIDLPIGDLMNPVYSTLNQLTASNRFPQISNETVLLNPNNFYDAKLHTTLPLINMEIGYNKRIKKEMIGRQQAAVNVYKRELVKDIKTAYYRYTQATKAVTIYQTALALVQENIRVNESLYRNGSRNATALTRAQAEKQKTEALINQQQNNLKNARNYFNFLLNRELKSDIVADTALMNVLAPGSMDNAGKREELDQIRAVHTAYELQKGMEQSNRLPKLNAFLDLGSQAFNFKVDDKTLYYFGGISLQWDLFTGGRTNAKIRQAAAEIKQTQALLDETELALKLQVEEARNNLNTATANYTSAQAQTVLSERYYNDQFKVYKEGQLLYIELLDAQNQLTSARLQLAVAQSDIGIALAALERSQASYPL